MALAAIALTFFLLVMPGFAGAQVITVTTLADPTGAAGSCSLRQAITNAELENQAGSTNCAAGTGLDTIVFQSGLTGTISLGSSLPAINNGETLTIAGPTNGPGITVDGGKAVRLMVVTSGATLNLQFLTLANGSAAGSNGGLHGSGGNGEGGGIYNLGTLTVSKSTLSANQAIGGTGGFGGGGGLGGAIFNDGSLTLTDNTLSGNQATGGIGLVSTIQGAGAGGAIYNNTGTLTVTNSTFSANQATGGGSSSGGGAIYNDSGTITVVSSTFSGNIAPSDYGGAINMNPSGSAALMDTILASSTGGNCLDDPMLVSDDGYNLSDDGTCPFGGVPFGATSSQNNVSDIDLATGLAQNGGPTETIALESGSAAIAQIPTGDCLDAKGNPLTTDQRGFQRPAPRETKCCIGAYEFGDPTATATATPTATATATATTTATATASTTATQTPTATPAATQTATPTATATVIATVTATATGTRTASPTATETATATETLTATATVTATATTTASPTATATATRTETASSTATSTATATPSATQTATPTAASTNTPTATATSSATATNTATPTSTPTPVAGKLKVSPKELKFGTVGVNDAVTKTVTIRNAGKTTKKKHPLPILIEMEGVNPTPSPFSITMQCSDDDLMPGGKGVPKSETMCVAKVQFKPTDAMSYSGTLTIIDNLEPNEMQTVQITGKGKAPK